jgi:hypothetical protein
MAHKEKHKHHKGAQDKQAKQGGYLVTNPLTSNMGFLSLEDQKNIEKGTKTKKK